MRLLILATCLISSLFSYKALARACSPLQEFDKITETVTKKFFDKTFRGIDWSSRVAFYRKQLDCAADENAVAQTANKLLEELKVSHTGVFVRNDLDYWALNSVFSRDLSKFQVAFSGIWAKRVGRVWVARNVLLGSPAHIAGVRPGDHLISLDGHDFSPLGWKRNRPSVLRFTSDGITFREVSISSRWESLQDAFLRSSLLSREIIETGGKRIGYFHLWCGTHEKFLSALNQSLKHFAQAKVEGVIIDLRDGFGGANLDYLKELQKNPALAGVKKVFLINEGVRSGKEWISAVFKKEKMGKLIGTKTAGAFLGGAPFQLFGGRYFLYLAVAEFVPEGIGPIEGIGVSPDIPISGCQEFCKGSDPQLERAIEFLGHP